jgi:Crp-like helix-turn-helix domain
MLTIKVTNTDLAALAGCSRQQLTVLLNELEKSGATARQGSQMILNVAKLNALAKPARSHVNKADACVSRALEILGDGKTPDTTNQRKTAELPRLRFSRPQQFTVPCAAPSRAEGRKS